MTTRLVNVHSVPARGDVSRFRAEERPRIAERLADRMALVFVAAAERGAVPERWGLGAALLVLGRTVVGGFLVVADDLAERDRAALSEWADRQALTTPYGDVPVQLLARSSFCHPTEGPLLRHTYRGGGWLVTADEGRSLGLLADWWGPARGRFVDGFSLGLPGCGHHGVRIDRTGLRHPGWQADLHTPPLRAKALGEHGLLAEWGRAGKGGKSPSGEPAGHWEKGKPFLGRIVDLVGPAFALDGCDTASLATHLGAFGLDGGEVRAALPVNAESADQLLALVRSVHTLALTLDAEAARWLVTPDGEASVGLRDLVSGGSVARLVWARSGATPPLAKFVVPDDAALDAYAAGSHGGWCTADLPGELLPAMDVDARQAYPAAACLAGIHGVLFARELSEVDVLREIQALSAAAAAGDWRPFFERATYERFAFTRCLVLPDGEPWPVELPERHGPRLYVRRLTSTEPVAANFGDVMVASFLAGRAVTILSATGLVPFGVEDVRPIPLRDGVVVPAGTDPLAALVRLRPEKGTDDRLRAAIRGITNPAAWGLFARLDQHRLRGQLVEKYAAWSWPSIAACVPAVVRMWLAMVERAVTDAGGAIVARDTDGFAVLASLQGGKVQLGDGRVLKVLGCADVDAVLGPFDALDPFGDGGAFWSVEREPLQILSLGRKRYAKVRGGQVVDGTEHSLGGGVADPPGWGVEAAAALRPWVRTVHEYALARATGKEPGWSAPWDEGEAQPFPVLRRFSAASPGALADVPAALGLHPFGPWIEAEPDKVISERVALALDPGDDLTGWAELAWVDRAGEPVRVGTAPRRLGDIILRTLSDYAWSWAQPAPVDEDGLVEIDPRLVRRVGRGGALIDAQLADPDARAEDHQVLYSEGDAGAFVAEAARRIGPRPFARLTGLPLRVAERAALGRPISAASVERAVAALTGPRSSKRRCALEGCEAPVSRPNARYCTRAHGDRAYRLRKARRAAPPGPSVCATCGAVRVGDVAGPCPACGDRAPVVVETLTCPGCGVERIGDLSSPCRFCERKERP